MTIKKLLSYDGVSVIAAAPIDLKHPFRKALDKLAGLGKDLAWSADASNYSYERRKNAQRFNLYLPIARKAYHDLRLASTNKEALAAMAPLRAVIKTGIESNWINRIIDMINENT